MPNEELEPGPANSCVTLIDSPAIGRPDEYIAVPEIVATRPGTMAKSPADDSWPIVTLIRCASTGLAVLPEKVGRKPIFSSGRSSTVHVVRVVAITKYSPGSRPVMRNWPVSSVRLKGPPPATGTMRRLPRKYFHCAG